jgi:3-hydroxybutyryl-CoA dehydratase
MIQLPCIGDFATSSVIYTREKVELFSKIIGDFNPVHLDNRFAESTIFKKPIVHGIFVAGQISALIANKLPGPGSIYLYQDLNFLSPVYHDNEISCTLRVVEVKSEKKIFILNTLCINQDGIKVIEGKAVIKMV